MCIAPPPGRLRHDRNTQRAEHRSRQIPAVRHRGQLAVDVSVGIDHDARSEWALRRNPVRIGRRGLLGFQPREPRANDNHVDIHAQFQTLTAS